MSENGTPPDSPEVQKILEGVPALPDAPFPLRLKRFTSFCQGESKELDRADAQAVLAAMQDMSGRVFRQMMAINTMNQSMPLIRRAMEQGLTLIDAFNQKVSDLDKKGGV